MEPLFKGIISGITISFLIGPIFFALADITISKGWKCGLSYVFGVLLSDVILIYLVETILQRFPFDSIKTEVGITGGILLIIFGIATFLSKSSVKALDVTNVRTLAGAFVKELPLIFSIPL